MKEKRYLCNWWDKKSGDEKVKFKLKMWLITFLIIFLPVSFFRGLFSPLDYPEETFKELEEVYIPYVHEGIGVDLIGLKEKVAYVDNIRVYDEEFRFRFGRNFCGVTVIMDKNYNVLSVDRIPKTQLGYSIQHYVTTIAIILVIIVVILAVENFTLEFFIQLSRVLQRIIRKFHKKHKS